MLKVVLEHHRLRRLMRAAPARLAAERSRRLRELVRHAFGNTDYYRRRFDDAGLTPETIHSEADLERVPISTRADLQEAGVAVRTSRAFGADRLTAEKTSGSSGRPLELRVDPAWIATRNAMFLRALGAAGYRPGRRMMLLTEGSERRRRWPVPWRYLPFDAPPEALHQALYEFRPEFLYGWVTPLRRLAEHLRERGTVAEGVRAVVTTAEALDASTRALLEEQLDAEVFQIYGLTEMGAVGWECAEHDGLHIAADSILVEVVAGRLLLTNLRLLGSPLIRYDCGDLAVWHPSATCDCGCAFPRLARVEGREVDCVELPDGTTVSPYRFTLALENIQSLSRYQVIQSSPARLEVSYVLDGSDAEAPERVRAAVAGLVGSDVQVVARETSSLEPEPGRKFRVVERRMEEDDPR